MNYYLLPYFNFFKVEIQDNQIEEYLSNQSIILERMIEDEVASVTTFMNAQLCLSALSKNSKHLLDRLESSLVSNDRCYAYTEKFSDQLHNFGNQAIQNDVYTEYYHWIIAKVNGKDNTDIKIKNIENYVIDNKYVFNQNNSNTAIKYRMKSELFSQIFMALEISRNATPLPLDASSILESKNATAYISAEYIREKISEILQKGALHSRESIVNLIESCSAEYGLNDFDPSDKKDDFMGSKKRSERDQSIFSPLSTLHGIYLYETAGLSDLRQKLIDDSHDFFAQHSLNIPNYKMRDVPVNFGPGNTVIETLALNTILTL